MKSLATAFHPGDLGWGFLILELIVFTVLLAAIFLFIFLIVQEIEKRNKK